MAADMFLKIDDIPGESEVKGHEGEIEVLSFSWGVANMGTFDTGGGGGAGHATFNDISMTRYVDKASNQFFLKCATGKHIAEAIFVARKAGGEQEDYLKMTFTDVLITSVSTSGGGDRPTESLSMGFSKIKIEYRVQKADGSMEGWAGVEYDVKKREEVA